MNAINTHRLSFYGIRVFSGACRFNIFPADIGAYDMKNIINYAIEKNEPFINGAFNEIDSLILSKLAYLNFDGFVSGLSDAATAVDIEEIAEMDHTDALFHNTWDSRNNRRLFFALADSSRFRDMNVIFYVNKTDPETEKQFSAVTFLLDDGSAYIAYRGTDSTFVGWKEDFNMAFISPVPSQEEGVAYLNAVADRIPCPLKIG